MANTGTMRWVDSDDLPRFEQGVVVAAQVARPPLGWTGNHALARCCLRTPRPFLNGGGEWRRTYVLLRPETAGEETTWRVTRGWVPWSLLKNPHGVIPFPGYRILWIVTFFFDRTAWPAQDARPVVMEVKAVPRWEPAAEGERVKTRSWCMRSSSGCGTTRRWIVLWPFRWIWADRLLEALEGPSSKTHGART